MNQPEASKTGDGSVRAAIVSAAMRVFTQKGYEGATIREIVEESGYSRPTVYSYFNGKEELFTSIVEDACRELLPDFDDMSGRWASASIPEALTELAHRYRDIVLSPAMMELFRLAVAESRRFPAISHGFFNAGPLASQRALSSIFSTWIKKGRIDIRDPMRAAEHFEALIVGSVRRRTLFIDEPLNRRAVNEAIKAGLAAFLRAYPPTGQ